MSEKVDGGRKLRAPAQAIASLAAIIAVGGLAVLFHGCGGEGHMSNQEHGSESTTMSHEGHMDMTAPAEEAAAEDAGAENAAAGETLQKTCPVMGMPIDKRYYADYEGRRIYFCCPDCAAKFEKDPKAYLEKVDAEINGDAAKTSS